MKRRTMLRGLLGIPVLMGLDSVLNGSGAAERVDVGGSTLDVSIGSDQFELGRTPWLDWVARSAKAVTAYFGRFPVAHARVRITVSQFGRISNGVSFGDGGAHCRISVGRHATLKDLYSDWELTHEMLHFGFPSVEDRHHWVEEGGATYVGPIARAPTPILTANRVWGAILPHSPPH